MARLTKTISGRASVDAMPAVDEREGGDGDERRVKYGIGH